MRVKIALVGGFLLLSVCSYGQDFSLDEKHRILRGLKELEIRREQVLQLEDFVKRYEELAERSQETLKERIALEGDKLEVERQKTELERSKAELYRSLYESLTKKPGFGCKIKKLFSLGLAACS